MNNISIVLIFAGYLIVMGFAAAISEKANNFKEMVRVEIVVAIALMIIVRYGSREHDFKRNYPDFISVAFSVIVVALNLGGLLALGIKSWLAKRKTKKILKGD